MPCLLCYAMQVFCSKIGLAPYIEVALHHRKAKVLMVTDAVVYIPEDPPEARHSHSHLCIIIRRLLSEVTARSAQRYLTEHMLCSLYGIFVASNLGILSFASHRRFFVKVCTAWHVG